VRLGPAPQERLNAVRVHELRAVGLPTDDPDSSASNSNMRWNCPACDAPIRHEAQTGAPARVYRCSVCRLELVVDAKADRLVLAPFQPVDDPIRP
jgi:hypothetical protein